MNFQSCKKPDYKTYSKGTLRDIVHIEASIFRNIDRNKLNVDVFQNNILNLWDKRNSLR